MNMDELLATLNLWAEQIDHKPDDLHEVHFKVQEMIRELRAMNQEVPEDLLAFDRELAERIDNRGKAGDARQGPAILPKEGQAEGGGSLRYLHAMVRVSDIAESLDFYCNQLGLIEVRRRDSEKGRFTTIHLCAPDDVGRVRRWNAPTLELTYNWEPEDYGQARHFGHIAFQVEDIYAVCQRFLDAGTEIARPPRDGHMAFIRSPDGISIELLQKGDPLPVREPWASMENIGGW